MLFIEQTEKRNPCLLSNIYDIINLLTSKDVCGSAGIGRQACLRGKCPVGRAGSSPAFRTIILLKSRINYLLTRLLIFLCFG